MVNFCNHMTLATDFSSVCWLIAFSCANMSDLDVSQSVHVDKMEELSKELTDGYNGQLENWFCVHKFGIYLLMKTIRSVADEMSAKGTINWGCIVALYTFVCLFVKSLAKAGNICMIILYTPK